MIDEKSILELRDRIAADECSMKPLTSEWIEKAEGDFATAGREIRVRNTPNFDAVCFQAQRGSGADETKS